MESNSEEAVLDCTVFEDGRQYNSEIVLSATALNQLLNELVCRDIELDFDSQWKEIRLPDGGTVFHMQIDTADFCSININRVLTSHHRNAVSVYNCRSRIPKHI